MTSSDRNLLGIAGIGLIAMALIGSVVASSGRTGGGMGMGMGGQMSGHMSGPFGASAGDTPSPFEGAREIEVVATEFGLDPNVVRIEAGARINISLSNEGGVFHDLTIEELGVQIPAQPGTESSAGITAGQGRYRYFCSVPGHAEAGMEGFLIAN